jgi:ribonuclease HII
MAAARKSRSEDRLRLERALVAGGVRRIAGVDEAGRGPLAGPVVAAAAMLPPDWIEDGMPDTLSALNDSKQLSEKQREGFFHQLTNHEAFRYAVAQVQPEVIDTINILQATHRAMNEALSRLHPPPEHVLVDGREVATMFFAHTAVVRGDARSYSIAAASVLAKVTRDRLMLELDRLYPAYGFALHKGYGTPDHLAALARHGPCPLHRRSFAPLKPRQPDLFERGLLGPD